MSESFTSVSKQHMQEGITDLDAAEKRQEEIITALKTELDKSLAQWTGPAVEAYAQVKQDWDKSAERMKQITGKMKTVLNEIADGYQANEDKVTKSWI